uniref:INO80 complex subunit 3 N-terminal domain-containing protein n=1 Tax=Bionectria ochroleuca TaxID=29856 RepID=A0A8H7K5S1_BIOOC
MVESPVKTEGDAAPRPKAGYKSWKKKYRKMRISFEHKMHEGEDIFKQEAKAQATVKRLAIENDRLLDILLEINNSPRSRSRSESTSHSHRQNPATASTPSTKTTRARRSCP